MSLTIPPQAVDTPPQQEVRLWPLLVTLRKQCIKRGLWEVDSWALQSCDSDRETGPRTTSSVIERPVEPGCCDFEWSGLVLELFRDERAAYRFNLSARNPRLFVICNEDGALMRPYRVTASQDEASSYMDGGEEDVYSIGMPDAIQCWIEAFIGRHGEPDMDVGKGKRRHHGKRDVKPQSDLSQGAGGQRG